MCDSTHDTKKARDVDRLVDISFLAGLHQWMEICMQCNASGSHFKATCFFGHLKFWLMSGSCLALAHTTDQTWPGCRCPSRVTGQRKAWP